MVRWTVHLKLLVLMLLLELGFIDTLGTAEVCAVGGDVI
jgi:hypothetical protein